MRICLVNGGFDTGLRSAEALLARYWHVPKLAQALAECGNDVTALQAFRQDEQVALGKATVEFVAIAHRANQGWAEAGDFAGIEARLDRIRPEVVHVFGMTLMPLARFVGDWCGRSNAVATMSFHGGSPSRHPLRRRRQRRALSGFGGFFFPSADYAKRWSVAGLIPRQALSVIAPEVSSPFERMPKVLARAALGLGGRPLFVWCGRLHPEKDPFTTLRAFRQIVHVWPESRLAMAFQSTDLLPDIRSFLANDEQMSQQVTLLGELPHGEMRRLFSAADFFVHSSRREFGSNVLIEALSCGAIPVVSKLPSLEVLTAPIQSAIRFAVGDVDDLARQVLEFDRQTLDLINDSVARAFDRRLGYPVLAKTYESAFCKLRQSTRAALTVCT